MGRVLAVLIPILLLRAFFTFQVGLIDDEAYHWSWTKDLALSYYDHPGMIAWLEYLSTALFGDVEWAIRLPSALAYLGALYFLWRLAREMFDATTAHFTALMMLFAPLWGLAGYVASPEPPFILLWIAATWVFWQSCRMDGQAWSTKKTWLWLGVIMGLGLNTKFPMALLAPGFGLYLLATPARRRELLTPWPWVGVLIATVICLPVFIWNIQADWPGFKYQFHDRHTGSQFSAARWGGWFAAQVIFMGPALYLLQVFAFANGWFKRQETPWRFLLCMTLPSIVLFYPQPFFAEYKPHWMGPAYMLLAIGAGALWSRGWSLFDRRVFKPHSRPWAWALIAFLLPLNLFFYSSFVTPWIPKAHRLMNPETPWNTTYDLSNEFTGWLEFGEFMNRRQREIHAETGRRPFLAALRYETTAQAIWGTKQVVQQVSRVRSHYTVRQKLRNELANMTGLDALVVTTEKYPTDPLEWADFASCTPEEFKTYRGDEHARTFTLWHCREFRGIKNDFTLSEDR